MTFIGSGSAFILGHDNYHSNILLEFKNHTLLIDCGSDARHALHALGYKYSDINAVYISHQHADHCGGLEWLAFSTKFDSNCKKPTLFAQEAIMNNLWKKTLSGGLETLRSEQASLATYFELKPILSNEKFVWQGISFQIVQTIHIINDDCLMPSFGLFFKLDGKSVFITTDTQFLPKQFMPIYEQSDIIFHDCETTQIKTSVHAHYTDLNEKLEDKIKSKMWLYHYNSGSLPDAVSDGFCGFVKRGQCFEFEV